jgi:hypothetical protein
MSLRAPLIEYREAVYRDQRRSNPLATRRLLRAWSRRNASQPQALAMTLTSRHRKI